MKIIFSVILISIFIFSGCGSQKIVKPKKLPVHNLPISFYGVKLGEHIDNRTKNYFMTDYLNKDSKGNISYTANIGDLRDILITRANKTKNKTLEQKAKRVASIEEADFSDLLKSKDKTVKEVKMLNEIDNISVSIVPSSKQVAHFRFSFDGGTSLEGYGNCRKIEKNFFPILFKRYGGAFTRDFSIDSGDYKSKLVINNMIAEITCMPLSISRGIYMSNFIIFIPSLKKKFDLETSEIRNNKRYKSDTEAKQQIFN